MNKGFEQPNTTRTFWFVLLALLALWCFVAHVVFAFRHPELTDTERFMRFFDALLFR
jgi:succinate dehydrogenase/fumarate reductase cytochrome b subunit